MDQILAVVEKKNLRKMLDIQLDIVSNFGFEESGITLLSGGHLGPFLYEFVDYSSPYLTYFRNFERLVKTLLSVHLKI